MFFGNVLHQPMQHVGLAQRLLLIGLGAVIQVGEAQRCTGRVMCQSAAADRRLFQVTA